MPNYSHAADIARTGDGEVLADSPLLPIEARARKPDFKSLRSGADPATIHETAETLARRRGLDQMDGPSTGRPQFPRREARQTSPLNPTIEIPYEDETVGFDSHLRADLPRYIGKQIDAACYVHGITKVSLILRMMAQYRDPSGKHVFNVRECDMVPDRRLAPNPSIRK